MSTTNLNQDYEQSLRTLASVLQSWLKEDGKDDWCSRDEMLSQVADDLQDLLNKTKPEFEPPGKRKPLHSSGRALLVKVHKVPGQTFVSNDPGYVRRYLETLPWKKATVEEITFCGKFPIPLMVDEVPQLVGEWGPEGKRS